MKKLIVNLAWNLINYLDPIKIRQLSMGKDGIFIKFDRDLIDDDKWTKIDATVSLWVKQKGKDTNLHDLKVFKNGKLHIHYPFDESYETSEKAKERN